jgi:hypothetical protein
MIFWSCSAVCEPNLTTALQYLAIYTRTYLVSRQDLSTTRKSKVHNKTKISILYKQD